MKKVTMFLMVMAAAMVWVATASAYPVVVNNYNGIFFNNSEVWMDQDQSGTISVGDIFWGVLNVQTIVNAGSDNTGQTGSLIWGVGGGIAPPREITGYFATQVVDTTGGTLTFGAVADPNSVLAAGEVIRLFESNVLNFNDSTQGSALATATDGTLYSSMGLQDGGYWYSPGVGTIPPVGQTPVGVSYAGLNYIINPFEVGKIDDPNEVFYNSLVDIWFNSEIFGLGNPYVLSPTAKMHFGSNDPAVQYPVPEPSTILLLGAGLLGLGVAARRRK